jgi:hypothetical protein
MDTDQIAQLTNDALLERTLSCAQRDRDMTSEIVALLAEVDERRLYKGLGCSSMFVYCTDVLRFSEGAAYTRIAAARASRRFPVILERLRVGEINLSTLDVLVPHLTDENHRALLDAAGCRSKREVEHQMACLSPRADVAPSLRALPSPVRAVEASAFVAPPAPTPAAQVDVTSAMPAPTRAVIEPLAPMRYLLKVTLSQDTHDKLQRARSLLRHTIPDGNPATILDRALNLLLEEAERTQLGAAKRPRSASRGGSAPSPRSRRVPASMKRQVWQRDQGRCAYVGTLGRCRETAFLEFHHVVPYADGGATIVDNLQLRCRSHNAYEAELYFRENQSVTSSPEY